MACEHLTSQLQVLDGSVLQLVEQRCRLCIAVRRDASVVDINVFKCVALTVELAGKDVHSVLASVVTDRQHSNASHIDIGNELTLSVLVLLTCNSTISSELLRVANEVVAVLVLLWHNGCNNCSCCFIKLGIKGFFRTVCAVIECSVYFLSCVIENFSLVGAEDLLASIEIVASVVLLNQIEVERLEQAQHFCVVVE